jgi:hypothetical protein
VSNNGYSNTFSNTSFNTSEQNISEKFHVKIGDGGSMGMRKEKRLHLLNCW